MEDKVRMTFYAICTATTSELEYYLKRKRGLEIVGCTYCPFDRIQLAITHSRYSFSFFHPSTVLTLFLHHNDSICKGCS